MCLEKQHPCVAREFPQGNFAVHKSDRNFSAMATDQAQEQNNTVIKGDGGAIGSRKVDGGWTRNQSFSCHL